MEIMELSMIIEDEQRIHQTLFLPLQKHIINLVLRHLPLDLEKVTS